MHEISNNVICATSKASDQPAHTRSLIRAFASRLSILVELLTEHHSEFLSLKGGCRGSSKSIHVKMPHCWKSHATTQMHQEMQDRLYSCTGRVVRSLLHLSEMALSYSACWKNESCFTLDNLRWGLRAF